MNNEHTLIGNNGLTIGDLASFWQAIAKEFSTFKNIYGYGLMNEPHDLTRKPAGSTWRKRPSMPFGKSTQILLSW